jgi:glycine oxidase
VAGAGVVGLSVALALSRRGATVALYDDYSHPSASAVAAGMLAPAFESAFDPQGGGYALLSAALERWPALAEAVGAKEALIRCGGLYAGHDEAKVAETYARLQASGARVERLTAAMARKLQPGLAPDIAGAVYAGDEARVTPEPMLWAMRDAFQRSGGQLVPERLSRLDAAEVVVIAAGFEASAFSEAAPELSALSPIKGQLLNFPGALLPGEPMVRGEGVYIAPQSGAVVAGATMEPGRSDLELDFTVLEDLRRRAAALFPALAGARYVGRTGVRAATPDGLPMVGPSSRRGLYLATGMRRNGWLLAPLAAEIMAAAILGAEPPPEAEAFDPRRFL